MVCDSARPSSLGCADVGELGAGRRLLGQPLRGEPVAARRLGDGAEQVAERGPWAQSARHLGERPAPLRGERPERAARAHREHGSALGVGLAGARERLGRLAGVADAHHQRAGAGVGRHAEAAHARHRHRAGAGDHAAQELAAQGGAAHARQHDRGGQRELLAGGDADAAALAQLLGQLLDRSSDVVAVYQTAPW